MAGADKMEKKMTLVEHLGEMRYRIIISLIAVLTGAIAIYLKMAVVVTWLSVPLGGKRLHFIGPADGFFTVILVAVVGGIILGWPVLLYQALAFILPGCTARERKIILLSVLPGTILFVGGVYFGSRIIFPVVLNFFMSIGESYLNPMLIGSKYFSFLLLLTLAMGIVFEMPLVMIILSKLGLITSKKLRARRMYGYIAILMLMGFFVPADLLTLLFICSPIILLYELSIWIIFFMENIQRTMDKIWWKKEKVNHARD
jgi:sec-independent protein translocase protein TatC